MLSFNTPLLIVGFFLVLTLVVGLANKPATTFREYAVGNKRFPTAMLVASILGTSFGGGTVIHNVRMIYDHGLLDIIKLILCSSWIWLTYSVLTLRMTPFMQHLSIAETIGKVYGKYPRAITALSCICLYTAIIVGQILAISIGINMFVDSVNPHIITAITTLMIITYATYGGIRSITTTNVLQFISFMIIILLLAKLMYIKTNKSIPDIVSFLQNEEKFQLNSLYISKKKYLFFVFLGYLLLLDSLSIHRIYMCSSPIQAKKVFLYTSFSYLFILFIVSLIGLFVFIANPTLPLREVWPYVTANISPVFKGWITISILGMAMSTADSCLHACSIMFSHDIMECITNVNNHTFYTHQIRIAKLTIIVIGLLAMIIYLYNQNTNTYIYIWSGLIYVSIVIAPFILAILGFRGTSRTALIGMSTGILVMLSWNKWIRPLAGTLPTFAPILANGFAMIISHYLLKQPADAGWIRPNDQQKRMRHLIDLFKKHKKIRLNNPY
ncbi:sodium:solute symporter family protein [Candidatus Cardinium hertigii]|uniref:sodium:solute symporter family protein n=1 Tax=Candidatus Cardinium hertigii TaxID=247481 RepID=UPI003D7EAD66